MSKVLTYAQLVRLPNVFTAFADICLGILASTASSSFNDTGSWWLQAACTLLASGCLYSAGMVWNDYFDLQLDRRERPSRPLPSGRITRSAAARLGVILLAAGLLLAALAGILAPAWDPSSLLLATALTGMILLYDGWLKRTWAGPLGMGGCRFLNVLLGLALSAILVSGLHLAAIVGIYIVGVTWFARTEAVQSRRWELAGATGVVLAALLLALPLPLWVPRGDSSPMFVYLLVTLGFYVGLPMWNAFHEPSPTHVQRAVKVAILGLVVLDAALATVFAGALGLVILLLLVPAMLLGQWIYST